jgi:predicted  nucleic acid-binding Zn-ribbon protein
MTLEKGVQRTLMQLIKDYNDKKYEVSPKQEPHPDESYLDELNIDEDNESLLDEDEDDKENLFIHTSGFSHNSETSRTPLSPFRSPPPSGNILMKQFVDSSSKKLSPPPQFLSSRSNASARKVVKLEREAMELSKRNNDLQKELESLRQQENATRVRCEEMEAIHRAVRLKIESEALVRENDMREEFSEKILTLERELSKARSLAEEASSAKEQVANLKDEVDILQHSKVKLQQAENQMHKLKIKLEQMGDLKKALDVEEKAHNDAVNKCLQLENELAVLGPIKRQLEEYKVRATNAEVRLVECEQEILKLRQVSEQINGMNSDLQRGNLLHQAEAEHWRRTLENTEKDSQDGPAVGDGISELNPIVKEELLRLRNENARLKEFAAKREADSVQRLEEKLEDAERLADKFKNLYLETKSALEKTHHDLSMSMKKEASLSKDLRELEESKQSLDKQLQEERIEAQKAKIESTKQIHATKKQMAEELIKAKDQLIQEWEHKLKRECADFEERYKLLSDESDEKIKELHERIDALRKQSIESLRKVEHEFNVQREQMIKKHEAEINQVVAKNDEEREKLISHGKQLIQKKKEEADQKISDLEQQLYDLNERHNNLISKQNEYETKVAEKIQSYKQRINFSEARIEEITKEYDDIQSKCSKLEREKAHLQTENDRFRRQLGSRCVSGSSQFEELQRNFNEVLEENRTLKEKLSKNTADNFDPSYSFTLSRNQAYSGSSMTSSSLTQLRAEYEEKIEELNDEKRELIMKNSSLITEEKKAQKRAWEFEVEVKRLENIITSLQLQLERLGHQQLNLQSPLMHSKRGSSFLTPPSLSAKASKIWKTSKLSRKSNNTDDSHDECSPASTGPMIELMSPEFEGSVKKLKKKEVEGFKSKLMQRLSAKKNKGSPFKSMSLMDMAANGQKIEERDWSSSFSERLEG